MESEERSEELSGSKGREVDFRNPRAAMANGFGMVPESRKEQGLFLQSGVRFNTTINVVPRFLKHFIWNRQAEGWHRWKAHKRYAYSCHGAGTGSGKAQRREPAKGNRKMPKCVPPSRCLYWMSLPEAWMKDKIRDICAYRPAGKQSNVNHYGFLELPEIINMSDRVLVMCNGYSTGILNRDELTQGADYDSGHY